MKLLTTILLAAATIAGSASANTMNKCTDANGKVTFTDQPCADKSKTQTLNVQAPQSKAEVAQNANAESEKLKRANQEFKQRAAERDRADAEQDRRVAQARLDRDRAAGEARARQAARDAEEARMGAIERQRRERGGF